MYVSYLCKASIMKTDKGINIWLLTGAIMIIIMIIIGGITRLTDSGLSMVEWKVVGGSIPPLNEQDWNESFDKYKAFPEYQLVNKGMTLEAYKRIYFWEYAHRMWGRLIGLVFLFPWLYFLLKKRFTKKMIFHTIILSILGGLQARIGWIMVKSGLVDTPSVSHYKLALHFSLALFLLGYISRLLIVLNPSPKWELKDSALRKWTLTFFILICIQIIYGAFMSGLKAGFVAPTFPLIIGEVLPDFAHRLDPWIRNLFENKVMIQFIHRTLGTILLILGIYLSLSYYKSGFKKISHALATVISTQFLLGVITLLSFKNGTPVTLASLHQLVAIILLIGVLYLVIKSKEANYSSESIH